MIKTKILSHAKNYVLSNYGNLIKVSEPYFIESNGPWVINIKSNYPRVIVDDESNERIINALTLNKIGQLYYSSDGVLTKSPSKRECISSLEALIRLWKLDIERIITKESSQELSNVQTIRHYLRPIEVIINYIYHHKSFSFLEIENLSRTKSYLGWFDLLEELRIVEKDEYGYIFGDYAIGIREKKNNTRDDLLRLVISHTISERYSYMKDIMKVQQFGTVIHTNSAYYNSCIEADKIIKRKSKSIYFEYLKYYGKKSHAEIFHTLLELSQNKVIHYDKPYFYANEEIYGRIQEHTIDQSITPPI